MTEHVRFLFSSLAINTSKSHDILLGMIIGEIQERFEIENYLLTYREYFRRENFQAARFIGENVRTRCSGVASFSNGTVHF